ncbi:MAG: copper resistance system multicopper oxidase [Nitrospira sp. BO4]|jgi:CopA family copper-resistance protein|nr:copper resistance system multicopper oxidase [Nitrospira sp. BO4]
MNSDLISRRLLLKRATALGLLAAVERLMPAYAVANTIVNPGAQTPLCGDVIDLTISEQLFRLDGRTGRAMTINGTIPGPVIRLKEGQQATLRVTNRLEESTSIHWHGLLLPPAMDGVPGVSFAGIEPGTTFTYRFPVKQSGTYWFHSHSGGQELLGMYAPMIIDPIEPEPFGYERDYVVMLSDWSFESPEALLSNLKKQGGYYNFQKRAVGEFLADVGRMGFWPAIQNYLMWDQMRMDPTDFADVTGYTYTYLMNGLSPTGNWTGLFRPGDRVRLRFIVAAAMSFLDVRIPGLKMTVVQADGQNVQPVVVDEIRMGPAETYDVIVEPVEDRAYTIFAETMDRSGYARGTLATSAGMSGEIPARRPRPLRTMTDMGMNMAGMEMEGMDMPGMKKNPNGNGMTMPGLATAGDMPSMKHSDGDQKRQQNIEHSQHGPGMKNMPGMEDLGASDQHRSKIPGVEPVKHGPDDHGTGNQTVAEYSQNRMNEPGRGLEDSARRVLLYTDLKSLAPYPDQREPEREIELHLTGHMARYMWSFDGKKYSDAKEPIRFRYGERVRLTFVNDTMMEHPLHLHGMWMHLENGAGAYLPRKHTVIVKPAERLSVAISADASGRWAFHCHLLLHMEAGMFRVVEVAE